MWKNFFLTGLLVISVEDPIDVYVSQELIEVNAQEEVTGFAFNFESRNDNVVGISLEHASTGVLFLYLDWRHVDYFVFIKGIQRVLAWIEFENCYLAVSKSLLEWVREILSINWESPTSLCHREHDFGILDRTYEELWVGGISFKILFDVFFWESTGI